MEINSELLSAIQRNLKWIEKKCSISERNLADHYSKCSEDDQKNFSEKIMEHIRAQLGKKEEPALSFSNVLKFKNTNSG